MFLSFNKIQSFQAGAFIVCDKLTFLSVGYEVCFLIVSSNVMKLKKKFFFVCLLILLGFQM